MKRKAIEREAYKCLDCAIVAELHNLRNKLDDERKRADDEHRLANHWREMARIWAARSQTRGGK
jgi:hypothetical protein